MEENEIMDEQQVRSLLVKSLYFCKKDNEQQMEIMKLLNPDYIMFDSPTTEIGFIDKIQKATQFSQFDYKIYEEFKELKQEYKKETAFKNLNNLINSNGINIKEDTDQMESMSISFEHDYDDMYNDYEQQDQEYDDEP